MPEPEEGQPLRSITDPDELARALELELIMKRAAWERARAGRGRWRALSLLFLLLVVLGAIAAWVYFATELSPRRTTPRADQTEPAR